MEKFNSKLGSRLFESTCTVNTTGNTDLKYLIEILIKGCVRRN